MCQKTRSGSTPQHPLGEGVLGLRMEAIALQLQGELMAELEDELSSRRIDTGAVREACRSVNPSQHNDYHRIVQPYVVYHLTMVGRPFSQGTSWKSACPCR